MECLGKTDGVDYVRVNFSKGSAVIGVPKGSKIPRQASLKTVEEGGYKASFDKKPQPSHSKCCIMCNNV